MRDPKTPSTNIDIDEIDDFDFDITPPQTMDDILGETTAQWMIDKFFHRDGVRAKVKKKIKKKLKK
jgi:hypothetical protein